MQTHRRGHLVYAARGVLSVHTERGTSIVPANRVAWTPAGCTHYHRAHSDTDMRIVFLPASLARLAPDHPAVLLVSGLAREVLLALTGPRDYDRAALARLRRVLVDELREAGEQPLQLPEPRDDRLQAIARMLRDDPANNESLADLGQAAGASGRTLSRLFRDELGMTFYEWRTQLRIYHALILLADGHDATRVAHACGWANPSSFITAFTSIVGITPGRYRTSPQSRTVQDRRLWHVPEHLDCSGWRRRCRPPPNGVLPGGTGGPGRPVVERAGCGRRRGSVISSSRSSR